MAKNISRIVFVLSLIGVSASLTISSGCSSSSSSGTAASATSAAYPAGFAVSSPTAAGTGTASLGHRSVKTMAFDSSQSFTDKADALDAIATGTTAASCQVALPNFSNGGGVNCYGPQLDYQNHPEGGGGNGQLPGGDLGIWSATETDGTACTAAKMNGEINSISAKVDAALLMAASFNCLMNVNGTALPAVGASVDLTTAMNTALAAANTGLTVSAAVMERLTDTAGGRPVYKYSFAATLTGTVLETYLKHSPQNDENSLYLGQVWSLVTTGSGKVGFSVDYEKTASSVNYEMLSANYPNSETSSTVFNADGHVKVDGPWNGSMALTRANLAPSTGLGSAFYAWQAGTNDQQARIFNAYTTDTAGTIYGYGFFGFGQKFNTTTGVASNGTISSFVCNWAGPGNDKNGIAGKAQKQIMKMTAGKFVPDSSNANANKILYAPTTTCDYDGLGTFTYKLTTDTSYPSPSAVTNALITLSSDTDYAGYTAPTAPTGL